MKRILAMATMLTVIGVWISAEAVAAKGAIATKAAAANRTFFMGLNP